MNETYTVSELADLIGRKRPTGWKTDAVRQLRYWTAEGVLLPEGQKHTGAGRHRRYGAETAYLGAVLLELAEMGIPIGLLKGISRELQAISLEAIPGQGKLWRAAISGSAEVYLFCDYKLLPELPPDFLFMVYLTTPDEILEKKGRLGDGISAIVVNLTTIFRWMR